MLINLNESIKICPREVLTISNNNETNVRSLTFLKAKRGFWCILCVDIKIEIGWITFYCLILNIMIHCCWITDPNLSSKRHMAQKSSLLPNIMGLVTLWILRCESKTQMLCLDLISSKHMDFCWLPIHNRHNGKVLFCSILFWLLSSLHNCSIWMPSNSTLSDVTNISLKWFVLSLILFSWGELCVQCSVLFCCSGKGWLFFCICCYVFILEKSRHLEQKAMMFVRIFVPMVVHSTVSDETPRKISLLHK